MSVASQWRGEEARRVLALPMDLIAPNPRQPRRAFGEHALLELAASIRQHGLMQPVAVREMAGGYELIMGERRFRACRMLGMTEIDAILLPVGETESAVMALVENLQREQLHYLEEAEAFRDLIAEGMTHDTLSRRLGRSASYVSNKLRLLKLSDALRDYLIESGLSERHARALLPLAEEAARERIAHVSAEKNLTVRETEALVRRALKRLPVMPEGKRRVISRAGDIRLYVNAVKSVVRQMNDIGLPASVDTRETPEALEITVKIERVS